VRLFDVEERYGAGVEIHWRAFPLIADQRPGRSCTQQTRDSRRRAAADEPRVRFELPAPGSALPASSLPALTAAKAAERQGAAAFARFHRALFAAQFGDNLDISRADVLWRLAEQSGLDMARFERDCAGGEPHRAMLADYAEAVAWFGVSALPTVIFNEKVSLVGAVPLKRYHLLIDWIQAGEPGGLIPLDGSEASAGAIGQSAVGQDTG
jgi:predicted DsbA family dithiol-disulfide isomerase